ncbi:MAG: CRISPR-associated protein Cas10 [Leptolyngbyaceae cyanobacterium SU_3_3]|nr:CRISPR-associated protein Cas10 [Leptolyngbyaceae cyanobacterium SU_3_3]
MTQSIYTAITFAPVQGFIEKSRKLRDLYGSSFVLSYLARALCDAAQDQNCTVVSPALINLTQGTPNQIILSGNFPKAAAKTAFNLAWKALIEACRQAIEKRLPTFTYRWQRAWEACGNHAWEFFWAQTHEQHSNDPDRIGDVRRRLNEKKRSRDWTGLNWSGESSTLSGADAIAWHRMTDKFNSKIDSIAQQTEDQKEFYAALSQEFSDAIIAPNERLSILELIKRLITLDAIADKLNLQSDQRPSVEIPNTFRDLNRHQDHNWTGWFQGDGDRVGEYLKQQVEAGKDEATALHQFSQAMMDWGKNLKFKLPPDSGRIITQVETIFRHSLSAAAPDLSTQECLKWFYTFPQIWNTHQQNITVSVGFVWTAPGVPQRDVLQHCREAEKSAKDSGRDRIAIRILFNGGNFLEWACPWWFLPVLKDYRDRNQQTGDKANWTHILQDVATLEARHAFQANDRVALALFKIYFGEKHHAILANEPQRWNQADQSGILGDESRFTTEQSKQQALNQWVINLANVGFHLHRSKTATTATVEPAIAV